jgi:hypothetical protein
MDKGYFQNMYLDIIKPTFSFTFYDWKVIEDLKTGKAKVADLSQERLDQVSLNTLPNLKTVLHLLTISQSEQLLELFDHTTVDIPLLKHCFGNSPLHYLVYSENISTANRLLQHL